MMSDTGVPGDPSRQAGGCPSAPTQAPAAPGTQLAQQRLIPGGPCPDDEATGCYQPPRRIAAWMILVGLGLLLLASGFLLTRASTGGVVYERVTFTTEGLEENPVEISGLLIKPENLSGKAPGVAFANGFTGSKEWYLQLTRQMAKEGLIVLSFDLRGHGRSGGSCRLGCDEAYDMIAAARYLRGNVPEVDGHVTAMGHSLGGVTATRAGIVQADDSISSVVAIWCWTSYNDVVKDMTGSLDDFVGRSWFMTYFSRKIDINAPETDERYRIDHLLTGDRPPNYMLAIGVNDELASVAREEQLMERATLDARRAGPESKLKAGVTYGSFPDGTARRLVVTNDNHATEMMSGSIARQSVDWIKSAAGLEPGGGDAPFLMTRILGLATLGFGIVMLVLGAMSAVRKKLFGEGDRLEVEPIWERPAGRPRVDVLLYAVPVVATAFLSIPAAKAFSLKPFVPYVFVNETTVFNLSRMILLTPFFAALAAIVAMRKRKAGRLSGDVRAGAGRWGRSALYALMPVAISVFLLMAVGGPLLLPRVLPEMPFYFVVGVIFIGGAFWMEDYLFYKLAWPVLAAGDGSVERLEWAPLVVRGLVLDLVLIGAFVPLMRGLGVSFQVMAFRIPLLLILAFAIPVLLVFARISVRLRALTGGSLAFALMFSSIVVWFLTTLVGARG